MLASIVIPTKNEEQNIGKLLQGIAASVTASHETIIVDDSDDNQTAAIAFAQGAMVIQGQHKGLGQAILDGIEAAQGEIVVVMDADLSHNPHAIPGMLRPFSHGYDMVIGSRYVNGGHTIGWEWYRRFISQVACLLALPITSIRDATSGFFAFRKSLIEGIKLEPSSWKIMLEILLKARPTRVIELPIQFKVREEGKSKFNRKQIIAYLRHLWLLALWKYQRFIKFCIVGGTGSLETFGITWLFTEIGGLWYMASLIIAVVVATVSNYTFNTIWTYRLEKSPKEADYEWYAFYKGNLIQKWWKRKIAQIVWGWTDESLSTIDVGCGSSPIITRYNSDSLGTDFNNNKVTFMKEKCQNVKFTNHSINKISKTFPQVLCLEVIEHLEEPEKMIEQLARLSDSKVIIATPDYKKWLWHLAEKFTPYKEEHVTRFDKEKLEKACRKFGLEPVRHKYVAGCDLIEEFEKIA